MRHFSPLCKVHCVPQLSYEKALKEMQYNYIQNEDISLNTGQKFIYDASKLSHVDLWNGSITKLETAYVRFDPQRNKDAWLLISDWLLYH